jgi:hypothetical protein
VDAYLRHKIAACSGSLIFSQIDGQLHLPRLRSLTERILFVVRKQAIRESQGREPGGQSVRGVERQAQSIVQSRARHVEVGLPADLLLANTCQVDADREYIDIGGHSGRADRLGAFQVRLRRTHCLAGCVELLRTQKRIVIGTDRAGDDFHTDSPPVLAGNVFRQFGRANCMSGLAAVIERLVGCELRLEVVQEIGSIQGTDLKVLLAELVLRQQRGEHKDRVVAACPRLGIIDFGQVAASRFRNAALRGLAGRVGRLHRLVPVQRQVNCVF